MHMSIVTKRHAGAPSRHVYAADVRVLLTYLLTKRGTAPSRRAFRHWHCCAMSSRGTDPEPTTHQHVHTTQSNARGGRRTVRAPRVIRKCPGYHSRANFILNFAGASEILRSFSLCIDASRDPRYSP